MTTEAQPRSSFSYYKSQCCLGVGLIGLCFPIAASFIPPSDLRSWFYVIGTLLMMTAAIVEFDLYFVSLQLVAFCGAVSNFLPISTWIKGLVPLALSLFFVNIFAKQGKLNDVHIVIGVAGMTLLAVGYGVQNPYFYLMGGISIAWYSLVSFRRGYRNAILWFILNCFFTVATLYTIYQYYY